MFHLILAFFTTKEKVFLVFELFLSLEKQYLSPMCVLLGSMVSKMSDKQQSSECTLTLVWTMWTVS